MYVDAQSAAHTAQTDFLILLLYSQKNGYDDERSVVSDRVSSCVALIDEQGNDYLY